MLHAHRLAAVRICLLIVGFALLSATSALATSTHRSPTVSASRLHDTSHAALASEPRLHGRKSSSSRRARCVVIVTRAGKRRKVLRPCAVKKPKATGAKPSVQTSTNGSAADSAASVGAQIAVMGGALPTEALDLPGSEPGSPAEATAEASVTEKQSTTTTLSSSLDPSTVGQAVTYTATVNATAATGSVTFEDAGTAISGCADQIVSSGAATCTVSGYASASTHSITATYNGDDNYIGSTSSVLSQVVSRVGTSTTLTSSANPSMVGQPVVYTATVSPGAATGTASFDEAGTPISGCTAQPVSSGTATCTTSGYTVAGEYAITATYTGDGKYRTSTSSSSKQVVDKTGTTAATTTLASSLNPSTVGEAITYTATVKPAAAKGTVAFKQAGVMIPGCAARPISTGTARCTVVNLAAGWPWITAVYSGDNNYAASWSTALTQTVNKKTTTMTVSSLSDPSTVGEKVTYTARLDTTAATGTIEFKQAGVTVSGCSAQAVSSGTATCSLANLAAGGYWVTAVYSGDSNYGDSTASGLTQTVNKKTTTTAVSSSLDPSTVGQVVTYTAAVSTATATGTVSFEEAGAPITACAAQPVNSGTATCVVAGPTAGGHSVTAAYSGDGSYAASWSSVLTQTVNKKTPTTTVSSSSNPSIVGHAVTFTATVSAAAATGTVEFKQDGVAIGGCSAQAVSSGTATCTAANLAVGWPWITVVYSGDSNYAASWSTALTQTVNKKTTTTTVSSSSNPSAVGQAVTYTAAVRPASATGAVEFQEEDTPIIGCTAEPISSGTATCTVSGYPRWSSHGITAAYSGDGDDLTSASSTLTQTVEPPAKSTAPFRFFSSASFWNEEVPADAPLDPASGEVVGTFDELIASEQQSGEGPWIDTTSYSVPVYTVPADQPTVRVTLDDSSEDPALQSAWDAIPLPSDAQPAVGTDGDLVVWQPSTDRLWEFWRPIHEADGWHASWGGAMQNVSSNPGVFGPEAWPGAKTWWGLSASSLSLVGGLISFEDLEKGEINHALEMAIPNVRAGVYASPAQRSDGLTVDPLALPEGAHLRLNPHLNLAALHLPRLTLMMAEAAQRYGIFVTDGAGNVTLYAQDPIPTGTEPYSGPDGYFEGKYPNELLASFPWSELQLLKMELHETS
jgi:Bacterial Ig-like domain (group 3)